MELGDELVPAGVPPEPLANRPLLLPEHPGRGCAETLDRLLLGVIGVDTGLYELSVLLGIVAGQQVLAFLLVLHGAGGGQVHSGAGGYMPRPPGVEPPPSGPPATWLVPAHTPTGALSPPYPSDTSCISDRSMAARFAPFLDLVRSSLSLMIWDRLRPSDSGVVSPVFGLRRSLGATALPEEVPPFGAPAVSGGLRTGVGACGDGGDGQEGEGGQHRRSRDS